MIHGLAVVTAGATLLLIMAGGIVTSTGSGLAVPDWPTTFGYNMLLFPWSRMVGAVLIEHSHRLLGTAVGVLTAALAVVVWGGRCGRGLRALTATAVVLVCIQGLLGGLRVVLRQESLAVVHGCVSRLLRPNRGAGDRDGHRLVSPGISPGRATARRRRPSGYRGRDRALRADRTGCAHDPCGL